MHEIPTLDTETEVRRGGGTGGRVAAGIIGVLVLLGGSLFAVTRLGASGPESAEAAVDQLIGAAGDEDVLGVLAALDPGERDTLRDSVEAMFGELERLEVVDDSFELSGIDGVDLVFSDVTYRTEPVRDDLARVYLTGGTVTGGVNTDELPIGDFVRDTIERFDGDISGVQESGTTEVAADDEIFLVARDGGDGWRVSIGYTLAELAREETGQPVPTDPVAPVGAESPEAAVSGMADAVAGLDLRGALARLSPEEFAALHDYAGLFLADAEAELDEVRSEVEVSLDDLQLRSEGSGDRATVFVDDIAFSVRATDGSFAVSVEGTCATFEGDPDEFGFTGTPFEDGEVCADEMQEMNRDDFDGEDLPELPEFPEFETPEIGVVTERVDGQWYVAPIATGLEAGIAGLEVLDRAHLDAMVDWAEAFFGSFTTGVEESFTELPPPSSTVPAAPTTTAVPGQGQGERVPSRIPSEPLVPIDGPPLERFVAGFFPDPDQAACVVDQLDAAGPHVRAEIAGSDFEDYTYDPSPMVQKTWNAAVAACT